MTLFGGQSIQEENSHNKGRSLKIGINVQLADFLEERIISDRYSPYAAVTTACKSYYNVNFCLKTFYNYIHSDVFLNLNDTYIHSKNKKKCKPLKRVAYNNLKGRSIEERPKSIFSREAFGHWEMDTVVSGHGDNACLLVLTERMTRMEFIRKLPDKSSASVVSVLDDFESLYRHKFHDIFRTITADNGVENLDYEGIERSLFSDLKRTTIYYCHPFCSCERGSNENQNKLIRRFIPKGSHISDYSNEYIQQIENWINNYPRKLFSGRSAMEVYNECMLC